MLFHVNTTVSRDYLIAALWDRPPPSAVANLQQYVAQLRKALPEQARLLTRGSGYVVEAGTEEVDLLVFDHEVRLARLAVSGSEAEVAVERFERALALWRGQPAEGAELRGDLLAHVAELEERRTEARLDFAETKLGLKRSQEVIGDLRGLLAEQPLRERAWYLLMLALARAGQRDKALEAYRRARDVLVDELGIEPGQNLRQLQAAILADDGPVRSVVPSASPGMSGKGICLLPPDIADFVGRRAELSAAMEALRSGRTAVSLCVISGQGGVGKTTLAVHAAHRLREDFPDGQLYVNLRGGNGHPADPEEVLGRFLRALGVGSAAIPVGLDQRAELYRSVLADGRYLVVLDDAADEGQLEALLPGTPGCAVLIVSRHRLTALPAARMIEVSVMPADEAAHLLHRIIGPERAAQAPGDADVLVRLCAGLPLAVRIAGAKLAARPHWSLEQLVTRLIDTRSRLGQLTHGSQAVRASLAVGYQGLTASARRLFRLLGLLEAPDFAAWAATALLDAAHTEAEDVIEELVDVHLLEVVGRDPAGQARFRFHDLTRVYARECAEADEPEDGGLVAVRRTLSAWLTLTRQAHEGLRGGDYRLPDGRSPLWSPGYQLADRHVLPDPLAWVEAERAGILAAVRQSAALGSVELCWELAAAAMPLFETRSFHDEWRASHETALGSTRAAGDIRGQAVMLNGLARLHLAHDDYSRCGEALESAIELFDQAGDRHGHALALVNMAECHRIQGRYDDALACYEEASDGLAQAADRGTQTTVLRGIGRIHFYEGRLDPAGVFIRQAMRLADETGDVRSREFTRIILGEIEFARGDPPAAEGCFSQAMAHLDALGFPRGTAYACSGLASIRLDRHDFAGAERLLQHALAIYDDVGETLGRARVLLSWAELRRRQRRFDEAIATLTEVEALCQAIAAPRRHGLALRLLGDVHRDAGDLPAALNAWQRSLAFLASAPEAREVAASIAQHSGGCRATR
ncbi:BTAD domain-containing putative transcriptional regulator [Nonomuraea fuscirosea]|uniref:AfsR/SARP family transcriptional regulator n=1 Tax=Nonomuraea fuscirosea TaxID=1291556 RepID=UPI0037116C5E